MTLESVSKEGHKPTKKSSRPNAALVFSFKVFELFASLELAIFLILALAVVLAVGTVYESKFSAAVASREVYRSIWMQLLLWLFMLNLAAVAISRLPWKRQHIGFLITHLGIITLLLGSWITQRRGIDGTLILAPGESSRTARVDESMVNLFRANGGKAYELLLSQSVDFDPRRPLKEPLSLRASKASPEVETLKVLRYLPRASREVRAEDAKPGQGVPALRFRLQGSRATFSDWLFLQTDTSTQRSVGPAMFRFERGRPDLSQLKPEKATVVLHLDGNPNQPPKVAVARAGQAFRELGPAVVGKAIPLGWMDFALVLEEYHPSAFPRADYFAVDAKTPGTDGLEVIEVELAGQKIWLEMGASGQISSGDALYYVQYAKREVDIGFDLKLKEFKIGFYQGTKRPKSYASDVEVSGVSHTISMNEPLQHNGFLFYQSSYESDDDGTPRYSVLTVNYDPGRALKYLGSLMTVLGIISMFYFKPIYSGKKRWLGKTASQGGEE